jgi:hypothetical protein
MMSHSRHGPLPLLLLPLAAALVLACGGPSPAPTASLESALAAGGAASTPSLGSAASFAVLAGTAVACTDATIAGNVGVYPGIAITQTSCPVTGTVDAGDTVAAQAHNDFVLAYDAFRALPCGQSLTTLDGLTLPPGVYCFDAAATSTGGVLTLDGPADGRWIFKVGVLGTGALTGTNFSVVTPTGTPACNSVYWSVAEAVTMTDSSFVGTILSGAGITLSRGTFNGDAFAKAAVTITGTAATACALGGGAGSPPVCKAEDFVTGGGWIGGTKSAAKSTFAVAGGIKHGAFRGHLTYEDHGSKGVSVKGERVTAYTVLDARTRRIEGTAKVNGHPGVTYQVDVSDNGEPGRSDTFALRLSSGYSASGVLGGGNIQLHAARAHDGSCNLDDGDDDHDGDHDCDHDGDHHGDNGHDDDNGHHGTEKDGK